MKEITLTRGMVALVDDEDFERLNAFKWCGHHEGVTSYAHRGVANGKGKRTNVKMHREIMGAQKGEIVDHIDGNGLNNQKSNLRLCSHTQNHQNGFSRRGSSSKYKGVCWSKDRNKWEAKIKLNGKTVHLGRFSSEAEAAKAYNDAAVRYYGEFARPNIIGRGTICA